MVNYDWLRLKVFGIVFIIFMIINLVYFAVTVLIFFVNVFFVLVSSIITYILLRYLYPDLGKAMSLFITLLCMVSNGPIVVTLTYLIMKYYYKGPENPEVTKQYITWDELEEHEKLERERLENEIKKKTEELRAEYGIAPDEPMKPRLKIKKEVIDEAKETANKFKNKFKKIINKVTKKKTPPINEPKTI